MSSVPEGRAANHPLRGDHFDAADRLTVSGSGRQHLLRRFAGDVGHMQIARRQLRQSRLLRRRGRGVDAFVDRVARGLGSARGRSRPDLCPVRAVISAASRPAMIPSLSVVQTLPSRRRKEAPALSSPAKPSRPVHKSVDEPVEADGHLVKPAAQARGNAVDHAAADDGLADGQVPAPLGRCANR